MNHTRIKEGAGPGKIFVRSHQAKGRLGDVEVEVKMAGLSRYPTHSMAS
jgi:hypothetical protein